MNCSSVLSVIEKSLRALKIENCQCVLVGIHGNDTEDLSMIKCFQKVNVCNELLRYAYSKRRLSKTHTHVPST
jgi:hypothetical protein